MKKLALLISFILVHFFLQAQSWADLTKEAVALRNKKDFTAALPVAEKAVEAARVTFGENHINYANSLGLTAYLYAVLKQPEKALPLYQQIVEIQLQLKGDQSLEFAQAANNLAVLYKDMLQYKKAEPLFLQARQIRKKLLGDKHPDYINTLLHLGNLYLQTQQYELAETCLSEAINNSYAAFGENHDLTLSAISSLAQLCYLRAEYEKAEPVYIRLIKHYQDNKRDSLLVYVSLLDKLAEIYSAMGQYEKAEDFFIQALQKNKQYRGQKSTAYVTSLNLIARFYISREQYLTAEKALTLARELTEAISGKNSREYGKSLYNLGMLYFGKKEYNLALELFLMSSAIFKKTMGADNPVYIENIATLASVLKKLEKFEQAEKFYLEAMEGIKNAVGEKSKTFTSILTQLAILYTERGKMEKAEECFTRAASLQEKTVGKNHPDRLIILERLALLYEAMGQYKKAEQLLMEKNRAIAFNLVTAFSVLSENEKRNYLANTISLLESSNSFLYRYPAASAEFRDLNFGLLIVLKSLSLADTRNMMGAVRKSNDPAVKKVLQVWDSLKTIIGRQYSLPVANRRQDIAELEKKAEDAEKQLNLASAKFRNQLVSLNTSLSSLQDKMEPGEAIVEFVRFRLTGTSKPDSFMYAAYVCRKTDEVPIFIPLCEEKQLQQLFDSAGKTATSMVNNLYRGLEGKKQSSVLGKSLYKIIWEPLEPYLEGIKTVSYSPAGKLYSVAFHALPVDSSKFLLDKYSLQQYTTTRYIEQRSAEKEVLLPKSIALFGNANFSMDSLQLIKQRKNSSADGNKKPALVFKPFTRSGNNNSWNALPGTASEVKKIKAQFDQHKIEAVAFTNETASEENLKQFNNHSPQVLHIATHGFFLPAPVSQKEDDELKTGNVYNLAQDPLLRSGLVLAGGNYAWSGKTPIEGVEDGIATAYEISQLDLSTTELVVLSACETALGDIKGSEGVFGLQRGFKMAGVKNMIVSLWQVPDKETAELMTAFYSYWMKGNTINEAFNRAQTEMRKKYTPYYWAAFVLVE